MRRVHIRYFAALREALGPGEEWMTAAQTVGQLRDELIARGDPHAQALARSRPVRAALDQSLCPETQALEEGCEVAFFPPVTGG
ncbi:MAG: MoaD/ThiS family protein [Betaproteobacteria bacterium]|nr:MoaD/ThiS family protein [Betaproteobacteria bacterium]